MSRIGIFICKCRSNISQRVEVKEVSLYVQTLPGVVYTSIHDNLCSDSEQRWLFQAIHEHNLDGVVLAACSPIRSEKIYRRIAAKNGFNPYLLEMVNLREQCSWVHESITEATAKAKNLVRMMVEKVKKNFPLEYLTIPIIKRALIIEGGLAGIQAALDITSGGYEVVLIEKEPFISGQAIQLAEISDSMYGPEGIVSSLLTEIALNRNIKLYLYSELINLEGSVGNFKVEIRKKAHLEPNHCLWYQQAECGVCRTICPTGAIDYQQEDEIIIEEVGAVVVLAPTITAAAKGENLARKLKITSDSCGFFPEAHPKLSPVKTCREGIFLVGDCQSPKNIPESIAKAGAAASKVLGLFARPALVREPLVAKVNKNTCTGCFLCHQVCAYEAIEKETVIDRKGRVIKTVSAVNNRRCQGCGLCAATCRSKSIDIEGFDNQQMYAQINAIGLN